MQIACDVIFSLHDEFQIDHEKPRNILEIKKQKLFKLYESIEMLSVHECAKVT